MFAQMKELGYDNYNIIVNLGSIFVFGVLYVVMVMLFILL